MTEQEARPAKMQTPCFAAGTLVHTKDGLKPIEEIRVGDWVLSYPDDKRPPNHRREDHEYTYRRVTQTFVTEDSTLSKLIVSNLANNKKETILVTANHPIYHKYRGWIPASEVEVTDGLENYIFGNLMVGRVYRDLEKSRVYNLEVNEFHTYYVGELGVWVHNSCEIKPTRISPNALETSAEIPL